MKINESTTFDNKGGSILGIVEGPICDFYNPTRNEHFYSETLWDKAFNSEFVKEFFENGGMVGELGHPEERLEVDPNLIAIKIPEVPKKDNKTGKYTAKIEILDTPSGHIAYTLFKSGFKLGISSRGDGATYTDDSGCEVVDEDTFDLKAFDLVLLPAVKSARLNLITESKKSLTRRQKSMICECIKSMRSDDDKLQAINSLSSIGIKKSMYDFDNLFEGICNENDYENANENGSKNDDFLSKMTLPKMLQK